MIMHYIHSNDYYNNILCYNDSAHYLFLLVSCLSYSSTLRMEAICSSETSGSLQITRSYNLENHTLNLFCRFASELPRFRHKSCASLQVHGFGHGPAHRSLANRYACCSRPAERARGGAWEHSGECTVGSASRCDKGRAVCEETNVREMSPEPLANPMRPLA